MCTSPSHFDFDKTFIDRVEKARATTARASAKSRRFLRACCAAGSLKLRVQVSSCTDAHLVSLLDKK